MQWVASTLHTTTEHAVSIITTADAAQLGCQQSTELTLPPGRFKWTRPLCAKDEVWFLRMCLHISNAVICCTRSGLEVSVWVGCILCVMFVSFEKIYIN